MNLQQVNSSIITKAAICLKAGKLVAFPTETVYGLGADARNDVAVANIFSVKSRPQFNPLILHVADYKSAQSIVAWNDRAQLLADTFWPGPLTLVLPRLASSGISLLTSAGGDTLAVRVPAHPVALALCKAFDAPIAAPSANRSGRVSPTTAQHVMDELGDSVEMLIDGGACDVGVESTVLDISQDQPIVLRPGGITREQIESLFGAPVLKAAEQSSGVSKSPGLLLSHYAPSLPVRLNVLVPHNDEVLITFGKDVPVGAKKVVSLSTVGDLKEAAANLFATLRACDDAHEYSAIAVMPIPESGLGVAINDRLLRASVR